MTLTRTGEGDVNSTADPAGQRPPVVSPAEAFTGSYRMTQSFASGDPQQVNEGAVTTACLRAGDRCLSFFHGPKADLALAFDGGGWALNVQRDFPCPGSNNHVTLKATGRFPLPQSPQRPLPQLTGHGHEEVTGACSQMNSDFDETFARTGD